MKHQSGFMVVALGSALMLSGCVDREAADAKLVKGCQAGVEAFLPEGEKIETIANQKIQDHGVMGSGYREVILGTMVSDGFHGRDAQYTCIFLEEFGMFNTSHRASIYSLDMGERIIGHEDGQIHGSLADMNTLTGAIDKAMR